MSQLSYNSSADYYGIRGNLQLWLKDFLTVRRQRVVVNGSFSNWSPVKSGVPQGIVLGPILFLIYINDQPDAISSSIKLFADDAVIYKNIETPDNHLRPCLYGLGPETTFPPTLTELTFHLFL